jgi:Fatty acid desaturase
VSNVATIADPVDQPYSRPILMGAPFTLLAGLLSFYFVMLCWSLYWLTAGAGWLISWVLPRRLIERAPLTWMLVSAGLVSAATQTVPGFFPDYTNGVEILCEVALWLSLGLFARCYLIYSEYPDTFEGVKRSITSRPLERWISGQLHHPIDAVFTRVWLGNSIAMLPLTVLLVLPSTINYFVLIAYSVALLLIQFPHDLCDHTNIHTRIFQPKIGASAGVKRLMQALQVYFEYVLALLVLRAPHFYRVQHVYVHHVEDNGPLDSQTTEFVDRTSFLDFSRHAFKQGLDLVGGVSIYRYLRGKAKGRQIKDLVGGLAIWWALLIVLVVFNPVAAAMVFISRFMGGNMVSLVAYWQHGLVDHGNPVDVHGNCTNYVGPEHGNLGNDYHVEHHARPGRHWAAYYDDYCKEANSEAGYQALVMQKETFGPLAFVAALWRKDYAAIASYGHLGSVPKGDAKALARVIEERTRPLHGGLRIGLVARFDAVLSKLMAIALPSRFQV